MTFPILFFIRFSRLLLMLCSIMECLHYTLFFSFSQYFGKRKLWRLQFYKKKTENNTNGLYRIFLRCFPVCSRTKKGSLFFSGFLGYSFYARRTSNSHHERYSYSLLGPGTLTAHKSFCLVLLHSCPDTVHRFLLRKTQTSTSLIEGSFAMKEPSDWHHPRCSGLRVQGTAISPAARKLYDMCWSVCELSIYIHILTHTYTSFHV